MTMGDYGLVRLSELTEHLGSSDTTKTNTSIDEIIKILSDLAASLRDESIREQLQGSTLPTTLVEVLLSEAGRDSPQLLLQVGRVAANYGAENSVNLDALLHAEYPQRVIEILSSRTRSLPFPARRALIASILNAVVSDHAATKEILSRNIRLLLSLPTLDGPFEETTDEVEDAARAGVAEWLLGIIEAVAMHSPSNFSLGADKTNMIGILDPVKAFTPPHRNIREVWWDSLFTMLQHYCQCLEQLASLESKPDQSILRHVAACNDDRVIQVILDFAEHGDLPPNHDFDTEEEDGEEDKVDTQPTPGPASAPAQTTAQKAMSKAKASVISFLTSLCWEIPYDPALPIWSRMRSWLAKGTEDRDDLMNAALMCFANGVRSADTGLELLRGEHSLLPVIMPLLSPNTKVTTQHALIGLLKNLAHPPENKVMLGDAGVIDRLLEMEVFSDKRDVVGTVQGSSAGLIKLLCLDNAKNSSEFLRHPDALDQIIALIKRTDDTNIGYEATRIFISVIKSVSKTKSESSVDPARLCQRDVITCLVDLLRRTWKWPILINDSIISLTLLAISGPEGTAAVIMEELDLEHPAKEEEEGSGAKVIQKIISSGELDKGIKSNAETLMVQLEERTGGRTIDVNAA